MSKGFKNYLLPVLFIITLLTCNAQTQITNEPDKFIFYDVVEADSLSAALLYHNALQWAKSLQDVTITLADTIQGKIEGTHEFYVYKEKGVTRKISGKVKYKIMIEVKEHLYRYYFTDFIYHYYGFDRYYNTIETGKKKRLDEADAPGWQKLWNEHRKTTASKITTEISRFNVRIIKIPVTVSPAKQETKKELKWE